MGWDDLNWLEDVHMGYEEGRPAVFDRNINGWVSVPENMKLPDNLIKFQMSGRHPMVQLHCSRVLVQRFHESPCWDNSL
jgi:hypothetical protein